MSWFRISIDVTASRLPQAIAALSKEGKNLQVKECAPPTGESARTVKRVPGQPLVSVVEKFISTLGKRSTFAPADVTQHIVELGYNQNSTHGTLRKLLDEGKIERVDEGKYRRKT